MLADSIIRNSDSALELRAPGLQLGGSKPLGVAWLAESWNYLEPSGTQNGMTWSLDSVVPSPHTTSACGLGPHSMKAGFWKRALHEDACGKPVFRGRSLKCMASSDQTSGIWQHITANVSSAFLLPHSIGYKQVPKASLASGGDHSIPFLMRK